MPTWNNQTTIDFALNTADLSSTVRRPQIRYVPHTDHAALLLSFMPGVPRKGPGLWRFNPYLLQDPRTQSEIWECLQAAMRHLPPRSPQIQWEWLKAQLRAHCQVIGRKRAPAQKRHIQSLHRQRRVPLQQTMGQPQGSTEVQQSICSIERRIDECEDAAANILTLRAGIRWREQGEQSTAYFYRCLRER